MLACSSVVRQPARNPDGEVGPDAPALLHRTRFRLCSSSALTDLLLDLRQVLLEEEENVTLVVQRGLDLLYGTAARKMIAELMLENASTALRRFLAAALEI
jgi:hypothetical protein